VHNCHSGHNANSSPRSRRVLHRARWRGVGRGAPPRGGLPLPGAADGAPLRSGPGAGRWAPAAVYVVEVVGAVVEVVGATVLGAAGPTDAGVVVDVDTEGETAPTLHTGLV